MSFITLALLFAALFWHLPLSFSLWNEHVTISVSKSYLGGDIFYARLRLLTSCLCSLVGQITIHR